MQTHWKMNEHFVEEERKRNMNETLLLFVNANCFASLSYKWWAERVCVGVQIRREERARVLDIIIHEVNRNNNLNSELVKKR